MTMEIVMPYQGMPQTSMYKMTISLYDGRGVDTFFMSAFKTKMEQDLPGLT